MQLSCFGGAYKHGAQNKCSLHKMNLMKIFEYELWTFS